MACTLSLAVSPSSGVSVVVVVSAGVVVAAGGAGVAGAAHAARTSIMQIAVTNELTFQNFFILLTIPFILRKQESLAHLSKSELIQTFLQKYM